MSASSTTWLLLTLPTGVCVCTPRSEADRLDEEAEHTKDAMQFGGDMEGLVGHNQRLSELDGSAVVLINAQVRACA